jgi:hypothetical protein
MPDGQLDPFVYMEKYHVSMEEAIFMVGAAAQEVLLTNDIYRVTVSKEHKTDRAGWPDMVHIAVIRHDQKPIHDWSDLQKIKNLIAGPEFEAVEIYPAESRLVDMGNQYHLWLFAEEGFKIPMGYQKRMVDGELTKANSHHLCVVCGSSTEDVLCPSHRELKNKGYLALVEVSNPPQAEALSLTDAKRTGNVAHIRTESVYPLMNIQPTEGQTMMFIPLGYIDSLQAKMKAAEENAPLFG